METQTFNLSLKPDDHPPRVPVVYANQYDVGRSFTATIYDVNGTPYSFTTETVKIVGTKPSGTGFAYDATPSGNTVSFATTGQMTVVHGFVRCGLIITKGSVVIGTLAFLMYVQQAALTTDTIIDSSDFGSIITDAVVAWMDEHGVPIDATLTVAGSAADAAAVGARLAALATQVAAAETSIADLAKDVAEPVDVVRTNMEPSKNLFSISADELDVERYGLTYSRNLDGSYTIDGTAQPMATGRNYAITWLFGATSFADSILPAGTYYFSLTNMVGMSFITIKYVYGDSEFVSSTTIVSHSNPTAKITFTETAHVFIQISSGKAFSNASFRCQIEECDPSATEPTAFQPPAGLIDAKARQTLASLGSLHKQYPEKVAYASYRCQGGCLVGDSYIWLLYNSTGKVIMHSLNVLTGVHTGATLPDGTDTSVLYHVNDITYNPSNQQYYVATLLDSGPIAVLSSGFVYQSSITPVDGNGAAVLASAVAYDRINDRYIIAGQNDYNFYIYDNTWAYVETITPQTDTEQAVLQGIDTDGAYIYRARTSSGGATAPHIRTYAMDGTFLGEYDIEQLMGEEIEGIAYDWDNGVFFTNTNTKGSAQTNIYLVSPNSMSYHAVDMVAYLLKRALT